MLLIQKRIRKYLEDKKSFASITQNVNLDLTRQQKSILVCYLDYKHINKMIKENAFHTNVREMFQIVKVLINLDFVIDICSYNSIHALETIKNKKYDYIFGMGETFREAVRLHPESYSIIYMTENPYYISYQKELERIQYFQKRRGTRIEFSRTGKFYKEDDEKNVDAVICMGEEEYFDSDKQKIYRVYPTANKNARWNNECVNRDKHNFLVFGTGGFVHKGNDILLEIFERHPEWKLYMCGQDVTKDIKKHGYKKPNNVVDCGFISVQSNEFLKLVNKCTFILLPSCSEGMPTGILTGMCHGLIPIVCKGVGLNELTEYCEYFDTYSIEVIEKKIEDSIKIQSMELIRKSNFIYKYAAKVFSLENYTETMQNIMNIAIEKRVGD